MMILKNKLIEKLIFHYYLNKINKLYNKFKKYKKKYIKISFNNHLILIVLFNYLDKKDVEKHHYYCIYVKNSHKDQPKRYIL